MTLALSLRQPATVAIAMAAALSQRLRTGRALRAINLPGAAPPPR